MALGQGHGFSIGRVYAGGCLGFCCRHTSNPLSKTNETARYISGCRAGGCLSWCCLGSIRIAGCLCCDSGHLHHHAGNAGAGSDRAAQPKWHIGGTYFVTHEHERGRVVSRGSLDCTWGSCSRRSDCNWRWFDGRQFQIRIFPNAGSSP